MIKSVLRRLGAKKYITMKSDTAQRLGAGDDYDWGQYNEIYRSQIAKMEKRLTLHLTADNYRFEDGQLSIKSGQKPVHPNHRLLYETLLQLKPQSVAEIGCGGGDHIRNLSVLFPDNVIRGYDRSEEQLRFLRERSPNLSDNVRQLDATMPLPKDIRQVDVCYTQAVLMHIQAANSHLVALCNMFHIAKKQILLMENWHRHHFLEDIRSLQRQHMLPWDQVHCYFRRAPEYNNRAHLMVVSREPLAYEPLEAYEVMRQVA